MVWTRHIRTAIPRRKENTDIDSANNGLGAYFEGQTVGATIAACIKGDSRRCKDSPHYADLRGENEPRYMTDENGWTVTSFQTNGL